MTKPSSQLTFLTSVGTSHCLGEVDSGMLQLAQESEVINLAGGGGRGVEDSSGPPPLPPPPLLGADLLPEKERKHCCQS